MVQKGHKYVPSSETNALQTYFLLSFGIQVMGFHYLLLWISNDRTRSIHMFESLWTLASKLNLTPPWLRLMFVIRRWLCLCPFIVCCYSCCCVGVLCVVWPLIYSATLSVISSFAIISFGEKELVAFWCYETVSFLCLFLTVPWFGLQYMIMTFPCNTHLHFALTRIDHIVRVMLSWYVSVKVSLLFARYGPKISGEYLCFELKKENVVIPM